MQTRACASNTPFRIDQRWGHKGGTAMPWIAQWPQVIGGDWLLVTRNASSPASRELSDPSRNRVEFSKLAADKPDLVTRLVHHWTAWATESNVLPLFADRSSRAGSHQPLETKNRCPRASLQCVGLPPLHIVGQQVSSGRDHRRERRRPASRATATPGDPHQAITNLLLKSPISR